MFIVIPDCCELFSSEDWDRGTTPPGGTFILVPKVTIPSDQRKPAIVVKTSETAEAPFLSVPPISFADFHA